MKQIICETCGKIMPEEAPDFFPAWVSGVRQDGYVHYFCHNHKPVDVNRWLGIHPPEEKVT